MSIFDIHVSGRPINFFMVSIGMNIRRPGGREKAVPPVKTPRRFLWH